MKSEQRRSALVALGLLALLVVPGTFVGLSLTAPEARAAGATAVTAAVTGPTLVSTNSTTLFQVSGWGGPAISANGTLVGSVRFFSNLVAPNLTGVSLSPPTANFTRNRSIAVNLVTGGAAESLTISIEVSSTYSGKNESTNVSYQVNVVVPYVISATIVNPTSTTVTGFPVYITLDGNVIGVVNVSNLFAGQKFQLSYKYPTLGLSSGTHTFAVSLVQEHGLVTFANGQTVYTESVYVTGSPPDYTLWYIAGIVAFFGAIFIFVTRVAARRRGTARR